MKNYVAKFNGKILVTFTAYSKQLAQAAAQRYARDWSLHLDTVREAA